MQATRSASDSAAAQLQSLMEEGLCSRSRIEELIERVAQIYTPVMVVAAVLLAVIPSIVCDSRQRANEFVQLALVMLVIACPCALVISTPIAYVCSVARAAQFGILIKGGKHMAALAQMTNAALDKSGTPPRPVLLPSRLSRLMIGSVQPLPVRRSNSGMD